MLITNSTFSALHDLDYKTPLYLVIFEDEPGGYCNHMVAGSAPKDTLWFDNQTGSFTATNTITGASSGATATISDVQDDGSTGILYLTSVVGTFQDDEIIYESSFGADLFDAGAGTFDAGTYSWIAYGTNTIANDSNSLKVTYDNHSQGAYLSLRDAYDMTANLVVGSFYILTGEAKVNSGSVNVVTSQNSGYYDFENITDTNFAVFTLFLQAETTINDYIRFGLMGAGQEVWLENLVFKQITNAALANGTVFKTYTTTTSELLDKEDGDLLVLEDGTGGGFLIQPGGALAYKKYLNGISGLQQRVTPEEGKGTIGGITFDLLDVDDEITNLLSTDEFYFHRKKTTIKAGYAGMSEDDLIDVMVGWVTGIKLSKDGLSYSFTVTDPQKWMQRKIFRGAEDSTVTLSGNALNLLLAILTSTGNSTNGSYDWFSAENGLGIDVYYINVAEIESVRDDWYPAASVNMTFTITERIKAKDFIEKEILKPLNLYPVVDGNGRFSIKPFKPPIATGTEVVVIDEDVIVGLPSWDMNLASVVNEVEWHYNHDGSDFNDIDFYIDSTSLNGRGPGKGPIVIKSKGISAFDDLMTRSKNRIFGRFSNPPIKINANCFFSRWLTEAGDIISFTHSKLPDIEAGTRGISDRLMEVINRTIDWKRGIVKVELLDTGFERGTFSVITPTMTVTAVTDQENFTVSTTDAAKYAGFTSPEVQICNAGMIQQVANVTILDIDSDTGEIQIDSAGVDIQVGWVVMFADYDDCTDFQKKFSFIADSADTLGTANDDAHLIIP